MDRIDRINRYVGAGLRLAREVRRLSVDQVARDLGMSEERLRRLESGEEEATCTDLHLSARALGVDVAVFFEGLGDPGLEPTGGRAGDPALRRSVNSNLGARMRLAREVRGLSLDGLAEITGIERGRLERIEYGGEEASAVDLLTLAGVLDIPIGFFFGGVADVVADPPQDDDPSPAAAPHPMFA
ncbi:MAG: helix-turn-helix domain-containing protein [Rhodospirillales bacterium]